MAMHGIEVFLQYGEDTSFALTAREVTLSLKHETVCIGSVDLQKKYT
jgi:hypothetical protein